MKKNDVKYNEHYIAKSDITPRGYYGGNRNFDIIAHSVGSTVFPSIKKGMVFRCDGISSTNNFTDYELIDVSKVEDSSSTITNQVGTRIRLYQHRSISPLNEVDFTLTRADKVRSVRNRIASSQDEIKACKARIVEVEAIVLSLQKELSKLEEFESDEAEMAHQLAEIFRSGGDEKKILETLLGMTGNKAVNKLKKAITLNEVETKKSVGLIEF